VLLTPVASPSGAGGVMVQDIGKG